MSDKPKFYLFAVAILLQLALVAAAPIRAYRIRSVGKEISLQLAPVDPYDVLTGYSMDLGFRVGQLDQFTRKPDDLKPGERVYALLRKNGIVYDPVEVSRREPLIDADEAVLSGVYETRGFQRGLWFGVEKLYIPEAERQNIANDLDQIRLTRRSGTDQFGPIEFPPEVIRADIKVDSAGNASLLRLHVGDKVYE